MQNLKTELVSHLNSKVTFEVWFAVFKLLSKEKHKIDGRKI